MNVRSIVFSVTAAAFGVLATTAAGFATEAVATGAVNVRTGPGPGYTKVDVLSPGEIVDVLECTPGWCRIVHPGPDGWVSRSYLANTDYDEPVYDPPAYDPPGYDEEGIDFGISVGPGGVSVHVGDDPLPAPPPPVNPEVCFFRGANFTSSSFCALPGDLDEQLTGNWDDSISSIQISGGATAFICREHFFGPSCTVVTASTNLNSYNNDVSSFRVD